MFKFDFDLDDVEDEAAILNIPNRTADNTISDVSTESSVPFNVYSVSDLLSTLPPAISYSPLKIQTPHNTGDDGRAVTLLRRDLFDTRFQLISEDPLQQDEENPAALNDALGFVDAPSDLVAGVYEGGLKTWECSVDLVTYLAGLEFDTNKTGDEFSIIEIGCGTAIPSLYCLKRVFSRPPHPSLKTVIHLQDYNEIVLKLVTFCNIILTWYISPASATYHKSLPEGEEAKQDGGQFTEPGELSLTPELLVAFQKSLEEYSIDIKFISGSWRDTNTWLLKNTTKFDLVLSSETIYRMSSLPSLIALLQNAVSRDTNKTSNTQPLCLVAAKVLYFGVGGGVESFTKAIEESGGCSEAVFETEGGVARKVLRISRK